MVETTGTNKVQEKIVETSHDQEEKTTATNTAFKNHKLIKKVAEEEKEQCRVFTYKSASSIKIHSSYRLSRNVTFQTCSKIFRMGFLAHACNWIAHFFPMTMKCMQCQKDLQTRVF